jgi:ribosomal protein L30E
MAKKAKKAPSKATEVRALAGTKKLVIGTDRVMDMLKTGKISKVFVTVNCPEAVRESIAKYASLSKAEVVELEIPNDELGVVCKKPFSISIAGVLKE